MWTKYKIEDDITYSGQIGKCLFFVVKTGKTWFVKSERSDSYEFKPIFSDKSLVPDADWNYCIGDKTSPLLLLPALPDNPVIVKPYNTFRILPGKSAEIFILLPIWIQFYHGAAKPENLIYEVPETEPSATWFGDPDNGLLGYAYRGPIELMVQKEKIDPWVALCPVKIRNESTTILDFQRLSIYCEQLDLYQNGDQLFTNEFKVRFKGLEQISDVHVVPGSPSVAEGGKLVSQARVNPGKGLIKRSFYFIKSISQY